MLQIDGILISEEILTCYFACDLQKCKGACCTFEGELGAPLEPAEIDIIKNILPIVEKYLPEIAKETIKKHNFYQGEAPNFTTTCINKRDCVFVFYENDIALCALEQAYFNKETNFRKPISCHLFPIRVSNIIKPFLYLSKISECTPAYQKGEQEQVLLIDTAKEALAQKYGENWVKKLESYLNH